MVAFWMNFLNLTLPMWRPGQAGCLSGSSGLREHYERRAREVPKMKRAPQEYLSSGRIFVTCEADENTLECVVQLCGEDVILYASDYPHWDSHFDAVQEIRNRQGLSESAKTKILNGNARRLFGSALQRPTIR